MEEVWLEFIVDKAILVDRYCVWIEYIDWQHKREDKAAGQVNQR